jgi:hypothetical protein
MPHEVVVVHPAAGSDAYAGTVWDYGSSAVRSTIAGWMEEDEATEVFADARDVMSQRWTLLTNYMTVDTNDRIEWDGHPAGPAVFSVSGPPAPVPTPRGHHHLEAKLRKVEG